MAISSCFPVSELRRPSGFYRAAARAAGGSLLLLKIAVEATVGEASTSRDLSDMSPPDD